jgi:hypothetical protein
LQPPETGHSNSGFAIKKRNPALARWACHFPLARWNGRATAVSQLLYFEATAAEWHFSQENATFRSSREGTQTVEAL